MKLDMVVLGLLAMRPYSGYDLLKWFEVEGQFFRSSVHHSQIYRALGRMVADGWIDYEVDLREGRPDAKLYRLTAIGRDVLLDWVRSPFEPTSRFQDPDCRLRLMIAGSLDLDATIAVLETELTYRRAQVAANRLRDRTLAFEDPIPELDRSRAQLLNDLNHAYGTAAVDQWISWLEQTLDTMSQLREDDR